MVVAVVIVYIIISGDVACGDGVALELLGLVLVVIYFVILFECTRIL